MSRNFSRSIFWDEPHNLNNYRCDKDVNKVAAPVKHDDGIAVRHAESVKDLNDKVADVIHSYIEDGYKINCKESIIDPLKDKDCTFKAVLTKDVDGIECKTVIKTLANQDKSNVATKFHKVDYVGSDIFNEEIRSFNSSYKEENIKEPVFNSVQKSINNSLDLHKDEQLNNYLNNIKKHIYGTSMIDDMWNKWHNRMMNHLNMFNCDPIFGSLEDYLRFPNNETKKVEFKQVDNEPVNIPINKNVKEKVETCKESEHIKVEDKDTAQSLINKIKAASKKYHNEDKDTNSDSSKVTCTKNDPDDELKDSLIDLINFLF